MSMNAPHIKCQSAAEFLDALDPSHEVWTPYETGRWAFRGQSDAGWGLVPSAFRPGQRLSFRDSSIKAPLAGRAQVEAEWRALVDFFQLADELGFQMPGDSSVFRLPWTLHDEPVHLLDQRWPPSKIIELVAIAQHHGVPTRLLDFTWNPLVAAYFAAAEHSEATSAFAVWAVDIRFVDQAWATVQASVRVVRVARAANAFLHAQSGLFLYDGEDERGSLADKILEHDLNDVSHMASEAVEELRQSRRVVKVTLPTTCREELLLLLAHRRITRAHLQPSLDNVVKQLWT